MRGLGLCQLAFSVSAKHSTNEHRPVSNTAISITRLLHIKPSSTACRYFFPTGRFSDYTLSSIFIDSISTYYSTNYNQNQQPPIPTTMTVPSTCCGRSGQECVCASKAKCSCGKQSALNCTCEKASTENTVVGPRCSCRKPPLLSSLQHQHWCFHYARKQLLVLESL